MMGWHKASVCTAFALTACLGFSAAVYGQKPLAALRRQGEIIRAHWSAGPLSLDPEAPAWNQAESRRVLLYPQVTTNPHNISRTRLTAVVKALYNDDELAIFIEWPDGYAAKQRGIGKFSDALAIQFPTRYGAGVRLPYVGMGSPGRPVGIWFWLPKPSAAMVSTCPSARQNQIPTGRPGLPIPT